jgi:hypothetical protein
MISKLLLYSLFSVDEIVSNSLIKFRKSGFEFGKDLTESE